MKIGDVIVLDAGGVTVTGFLDDDGGTKCFAARWHDKQDDGCQFIILRLEDFESHQITPS